MKKKILVFMVAAVLASLVFVQAAAATPPIPVSGDFTIESVGEWVFDKDAGGNTFWSGQEVTFGDGWSGDISGTSVDYFTCMVHRNGVVQGFFTFYFTGTVLGSASGTMVIEMSLISTGAGRAVGSWVIKSADGGLAGLHGQGTAYIDWNPMVSYSGQVHW